MGVIKCTGCGESLKREAESCPKCGAVVFTHPCEKCGQPRPEQADECPWCDHPVGAEVEEPKPPEEEPKKSSSKSMRAINKSGRSSRRQMPAKKSGCLGLLLLFPWM